jgi:HTH-type transcriptional regulator / antitoxin HigA
MTTGLKTPSSYYIELINSFPPRPITNEAELIATQEKIDFILDKQNIVQDDKDYLKVLSSLVYEYEQKYEQMPVLRGVELIEALMKEDNLQPCDLISVFGDESKLIEIIQRKQELTVKQIQKLGNFFHISPIMFLEND